jgi:hypothetical protein
LVLEQSVDKIYFIGYGFTVIPLLSLRGKPSEDRHNLVGNRMQEQHTSRFEADTLSRCKIGPETALKKVAVFVRDSS